MTTVVPNGIGPQKERVRLAEPVLSGESCSLLEHKLELAGWQYLETAYYWGKNSEIGIRSGYRDNTVEKGKLRVVELTTFNKPGLKGLFCNVYFRMYDLFAIVEGTEDVSAYVAKKYDTNLNEFYDLRVLAGGAYKCNIKIHDKPDVDYIATAVAELKKRFGSNVKLAWQFKQQRLEKFDIRCPLQVTELDRLGDKESLFHDCNFVKEFFKKE